MDNTAIKEINDQAATIHLNKGIKTDVPVAYLPSNFAVHSLEKYQEQKSRFTGQFDADTVGSFATYYAEMIPAEEFPHVFIDGNTMTARTFFDLGDMVTPLHGEHRALLALEMSAAYKAFDSITGNLISQRVAAEFVEDWRDAITAFDAEGDPIDSKKLVATIRRITIEQQAKADSSVGQFSSSRSAIEQIDAKSAEGSLPAELVFTCEPYQSLPPMEFRFRMAIHTGEAVKFTFHRVREEMDQERIATEFISVLENDLPSETMILLGKFTL